MQKKKLWLTLFCWSLWLAQASATPLHMQVVDADVRSVLMSAARLGGFNLICDQSVAGTITMHLDGEPEEILQLAASAQGLIVTQKGDTYIVTGGSGDGRQMHLYTARYADPQALAKAVNLALGGGSSEDKSTGHVTVDAATNAIVYYAADRDVPSMEAVLQQLDVPAKQVSLEAKVVALSKQASKELGVEWDWSKLPQYPEHTRTYRHEGRSDERVEYDVERKFNGSEQIPGIIQFGHSPDGYPFEFYFSAKLNAMVTDGKAKILARPNITTMNGNEAVINIGGSVPVPTQSVTDATTTTSITYKDAGIILKYTPRVNADGEITATVHTEVSSPIYVEDVKAYRFQKRSADTMVRLKDGETMVIGGLIGSEESRSLRKIPFLGDLPVLGAFFRNLKKSRTESELMIFLTAHVL